MKFSRLWAVSRKEFIHIFRDARSLTLSIITPMVMILLFGYALSLDVKYIPLAIMDRDGTPASRDFIASFLSSEYFVDAGRVSSYREIEQLIDSSRALEALIIPPGFAGGLARGEQVEVQALVDASDANTASIAMNYTRLLSRIYTQGLIVKTMQRLGGRDFKLPVGAETRIWFNEELESKNFIIPGLIALIMASIAALLTALTVAREWEQGSMETLISTPIKSQELIVGKIIPYFIIGMTDMIIIVLMGRFLFQVPLRGSLLLMLASAVLFLLGMLSLGMMISVAAKVQTLAFQLAMLTTLLPTFLLSGFVFPISGMPKAVQVITYLVPARYFVAILKDLFLKGVGLEVMWGNFLMILIFGVLVFGIASRRFKKRLE